MAENQKQENAIVATNMQFNGGGLEIKSLTDMKLVAETFINSGLVPKSFDKAAKVIVAFQAGREMGFGFWESLTKLHVVNGRIGMEAKAMKGKVMASGKCKSWKEERIGEAGKPSEGYKITIERIDGQGGEVTFIKQEAINAGLAGKDNWKNYLDDMLWNRAASKAVRRWFDDVIYSVYTPEELESIKVESVDVTDKPRSAALLENDKTPTMPQVENTHTGTPPESGSNAAQSTDAGITAAEAEAHAEDVLTNKFYICPGFMEPDCPEKGKKLAPEGLEQEEGTDRFLCPGCGYLLDEVKE